MTKYINADSLKIQIACVYGSNPKYLRWLNDAPAADVVPVRHAKLLNAHPYGECSNCGYLIDIREEFNYCPNCGARMDEE